MSRTPVREALRKLEDAGLVCTARNRWTRVAPIEPQDAHDICPIIWTLEPLAIGLGKAHGWTPGFEALVDANAQVLEALYIGGRALARATDGSIRQPGVEEECLGQLRVTFRRIWVAAL